MCFIVLMELAGQRHSMFAKAGQPARHPWHIVSPQSARSPWRTCVSFATLRPLRPLTISASHASQALIPELRSSIEKGVQFATGQ